jgi:hypothetical protein
MAELLMRAGVGEIVLFEFDVADRTNLGRVLHLRSVAWMDGWGAGLGLGSQRAAEMLILQ